MSKHQFSTLAKWVGQVKISKSIIMESIMAFGYMGRILEVDLDNNEIGFIPTEKYAEKFLGGRGIASRIYWERVKPEIKAFDRGNVLIFMTGPLVATSVQGASRLSVVGKSPMAYPEGYCYGDIGGFAGAELKRAGFDGVVIRGISANPVYIWIHNGEVELKPAERIWGRNAYDVEEALKQAHGENTKYITTGAAGENKVRTALLVASHHSTATGGFGAVMGSKRLKAIAISGNLNPSVANPAKLKQLNKYTVDISKRHIIRRPSGSRQPVSERVGNGRCYQCGLECIRGLFRISTGRQDYRKCQSSGVYSPWLYGKADEPVDTLFDAPTMCNDYSLCTIDISGIVGWLYRCYKRGYLTEKETGLPLSQIGTRDFFDKLLHSISYKNGFGNILAEGLYRVREYVNENAGKLVPYSVAAIGIGAADSGRRNRAHAILSAFEPRASRPLQHEIDWLTWRWRANQAVPEGSQVTFDVLRTIGEQFWGSVEAAEFNSYIGKANAAKKTQNRVCLKDSLGLCDFAWPIMDSINTPDHVGDPNLEAMIYQAVTGVDGNQLELFAERIFNQQRAIMVGEGRRAPEEDRPPEYNFTVPTETEAFVPGHDGKPVSTLGSMLGEKKFKEMMCEYYQLRGWEHTSGLPYRKTLVGLGIEDLAVTFEAAGYQLPT
ncbi:aldehyde ferredoxin oxidoreductase N-terminal domain-containing protein [Chloroflexota bacterium]